jgi:hypothetical protein
VRRQDSFPSSLVQALNATRSLIATGVVSSYALIVVTIPGNYMLIGLILFSTVLAVQMVVGFKGARAPRTTRMKRLVASGAVVTFAYGVIAGSILLFLEIGGDPDKGAAETIRSLAPLGIGAGLLGSLCGLLGASPSHIPSQDDGLPG